MKNKLESETATKNKRDIKKTKKTKRTSEILIKGASTMAHNNMWIAIKN